MTERDPNSPSFDSFEWDDWDNGGPAVPGAAADLGDVDAEFSTEPEARAVDYAGFEKPADFEEGGDFSRLKDGAVHAVEGVYTRGSDPVFAYLFLLAASVGLSPLASNNPIERYAILWTLLALTGLAAPVLNKRMLSVQVRVNEILYGGLWGLLLGLPLLLVGPNVLVQTSRQIFPGLPDGAVFLVVVFAMAPVETVFFRNLIQSGQTWLMTAGMAGFWSILLFFPSLNVVRYPMIALIIGTFLIMLSGLFSYVRQRNGVTAAWACQVMISLMWLVVPRMLV